MDRDNLTIDEWIARVGLQIRDTRVAAQLDQARLAALANVSTRTISDLERGQGSSLKTLVAVLRALGRTEWLETLAPVVTVSPMQLLRANQKNPGPRRRVRATRPG